MGYESTPARHTYIRLDSPCSDQIEPVLAQQRSAYEMARGPQSQSANLWLRPLSGWQLEPLQRRPSSLHELSALQSAVLGPGRLQVPAGFIQLPKFSQLSETGVDYGTGVALTADLFWQKQVKAGDDWSSSTYVLSSDQIAFPAPTLGSENAPMDRVAVGNSTGSIDQSYFLRFSLPGEKSVTPDHFLTFYFNAPAGSVTNGIGNYGVCFGGDGEADLYELNSASQWQKVTRFPFCARHQVVSQIHLIHISPSISTLDSTLAGSLVIECSSARQGSPAASTSGNYVSARADIRQEVVAIPIGNGVFNPSPVRVDLRRDIRGAYQISTAVYPTSAILIDDSFSFPFFPTPAEPIALGWFSDESASDTISGTLLDSNTRLGLTQTGSIGRFPLYSPTFGKRDYAAQFSFVGDGTSSPTLFSFRAQRDGVLQATIAPELALEAQAISVELDSTSLDLGFEHLTVEIEDALGQLTSMMSRGEHRIRLESDVLGSGGSERIGIFAGYVRSPESVLRGVQESVAYPSAQFETLHLHAIGVWARLSEAVSPIRFDYGLDFNSLDSNGRPLPFLVTDVLVSLFALAGFGTDQVSISPSTVRLHQSSDLSGWILEPQVSIGDFIVRLAREFLNSSLLFDPNLGEFGKWRLISLIPGGSIASFTSVAPLGKLDHDINSLSAGQGMIRKGSLVTRTIAPAANVICAYGIGGAWGSHYVPTLLKQVLVNVKSFDFGAIESSDLSSVDYLGYAKPMFAYIPSCSTGDALSYSARRLYDQLCHGQSTYAWQSQLITTTDPDDVLYTGLRVLRAGDLVAVNSQMCQITSLKVNYKKDAHQYAHYQATVI